MGATALYRNPHEEERPGYRTRPRFSFRDFDVVESETDEQSEKKAKQAQEDLHALAKALNANQTIRVGKPRNPKKPRNFYNVCVEVVRNDLD